MKGPQGIKLTYFNIVYNN